MRNTQLIISRKLRILAILWHLFAKYHSALKKLNNSLNRYFYKSQLPKYNSLLFILLF